MFRLIITILLCFSVVLFFIAPTVVDINFLSLLLIINLLFVMIFFMGVKEDRGNMFKHSVLFILGFVIVHFQLYLNFVLGNVDFSNNLFVSNSIVNKACTISTIALGSFVLGYLIRGNIKKNKLKINRSPAIQVVEGVNIIVFITSAFTVLFLTTLNVETLTGNYGVVRNFENSNRFLIWLNTFLRASIIIKIWNYSNHNKSVSVLGYIKQFGLVINIISIVVLAVTFLSGSRAGIIILIMMYVSGYFYINKKKPKLKYTLALLIVSAVFLTAIGKSRSYNRDYSYQERLRLALAEEDNSNYLFSNTKELSHSVKALHYAVYDREKNSQYTFGKFQINNVFSIIPCYQTVWRHFNKNYIKHKSYKDWSSADYFTYLEQGYSPYSGLGTTSVADIYIEFGLVGILFVFFLFGNYVKVFEDLFWNSNQNKFLFIFIVSFLYLVSAFSISRATILGPLRSSILIYALIMLFQFIYRAKKIT